MTTCLWFHIYLKNGKSCPITILTNQYASVKICKIYFKSPFGCGIKEGQVEQTKAPLIHLFHFIQPDAKKLEKKLTYSEGKAGIMLDWQSYFST